MLLQLSIVLLMTSLYLGQNAVAKNNEKPNFNFVEEEEGIHCPKIGGWSYLNNVSFKCYRKVISTRDWEKAANYCIRAGGELVSPRSQFEMDHIIDTVIQDGRNLYYEPWMAMTRCGGGSFCWNNTMGTGNSTDYRNWDTADGEPNNLEDRLRDMGWREDCVSIRQSGYWGDEDCRRRKPFVCETVAEVN